MLGVKEEEEEELIVAVAVATARIIMCALVFYRLCRRYVYILYRCIDIPDWIKRGPLKEREIAILLFGLFSVRAIRFRRKEEEEDLSRPTTLSLCVCSSLFSFSFCLCASASCVRLRARVFAFVAGENKM